jgi:drug/metabolite transporter (DMT)-like permease
VSPPRRGVAVALMLLAPLLWSSAGVITRQIEHAAAMEQVFWRSLFAFLSVGAFLLILRKNPLRSVLAAGWPGLASAAMWAVMFTVFVIALSLTTTANTLITMSISPLLTALLAWLLLSDPVPARAWLAAAAAALGIAWMFADGFAAPDGRHAAGMLVALIVPAASAANLILLRATAARFDLLSAVMLGGLLSCLVALPLALPFQASARDIALLALLGIFQLGLPCMLLVIASRSLLAPEIALLGLLEVVLGPLWAWLWAGEVPARASLIGGSVVLAALAANELVALQERRTMRGKLSVTRISG